MWYLAGDEKAAVAFDTQMVRGESIPDARHI